MRKLLFHLALLLMVGGMLTGCTDQQREEAIKNAEFHLFYISEDESELVRDVYTPSEESPQTMLQELLHFLESDETVEDALPLLPEDVEVTTHSITDKTLTLDFNKAYEDMNDTREVLTRAGVVNLFVQIPDIDYVKFTVEGNDILDSQGNSLSVMNADTFVEYSGADINAYECVIMTLYFTNKDGTMLVPEEREVYYNSNVPLERVVVEQLVKGPENSDLYPTLPSNMMIMGVTRDGTDCYVNLDSTFADSAVSTEEISIPVYSIVNSLAEVCQVENIQISVNGETDIKFKESLNMNQFFKKNQDLIRPEEGKDE